ncbi:hypothetical protein IFO69_11180 [Echinicola sp. CAU 1574]|uniref:Uncharacterized protein n=1 Tax=Echinicola arenosa TaxID=2774144 RepID=A0ABR9AL82_9BACT|nr:hypothetical protein [Echinicola arenosa]MBD8489309.1 hypothetical protein [Echinicola arenosa]
MYILKQIYTTTYDIELLTFLQFNIRSFGFFQKKFPYNSKAYSIMVDDLERTYLLKPTQDQPESASLSIVLLGGFGSGNQAQDSYQLV